MRDDWRTAKGAVGLATGPPWALPGEEERVRLLRDTGAGLSKYFDGKASNMVRSASGSAVELVRLVVSHFPGFRDACIYRGRQVFLYKRAQIFVGDVWGSFCGEGLGSFRDISELTMFADYRVPVVLRQLGIIEYSKQLAEMVDGKVEIAAGSEMEVEIRACTVVAVQLMCQAIEQRATKADCHPCCLPSGHLPCVAVDWWLWERGEATREISPPHHRTHTIFY
mmetsp:Transcript_32531/g.71107  ORF Transcript_32531/g.71107 Transcript_32531/m.71107 type:complete len:224 (-) Transcript_32531:795-1466(-)